MIQQIKSELKKILSIRSTYAILGICLALLFLFAFYANGLRATPETINPDVISGAVTGAIQTLALLVALVGALLVVNEYRYNTIMYTLTASNSRWKVLIAKVIAVTIFTLAATVVISLLSPLLTYLGIQFKGLSLGSQNIQYFDLLWKTLFFSWAYAMFAMIFAFIIRNQVGTVVTLLFVPNTVEGLLGLILKENVAYLPFSAMNGVVSSIATAAMSPAKATLIVTLYLIAGWAIAALLFRKRDAN